MGTALYFGGVLLIGRTAYRHTRAEGWRRAVSEIPRDPGIVLPLALLGLMALAVGVVNFERWGNPLTFMDMRQHYLFPRHPEIAAALRYGEFNLGRLWIGALYYGTGIPYLLKSVPPFAGYLQPRLIGMEVPPLCPLFTNPLTVLLAAVGLFRLCRSSDLPPGALAILRLATMGNGLAVLLILSAMAFTMRYRFDLAPFMTLAALVGYRSVSIGMAAAAPDVRKRLLGAAAALCVLGILGSHYILVVHKVWSFGVPMEVRHALLPFAPFAHRAFEP